MKETIKLFYEDAYIREFDSTVIDCQKDKEGYKVVLERTAFFPEGGGQYGDVGLIDDVLVLDTQEKDGIIYHMVKQPLEIGTTVHGKIDWKLRFDRMQQHSGEHIVSGIVHERFGYNNVGFHLGEDYCTMDFDGPISKEELREIEIEANKIVFENVDIQIMYPTKTELIDLEYRSKIDIAGQVRIVNIPGVDMCACCAPHLKQTGEAGLIKLVDMTNYKGGERINMLAGMRALNDYQTKQDNAKVIGSLLCEKENQISDGVKKLKEELSSLKNKLGSLQRELLQYKASQIDVSVENVCIFDSELSGDHLRELMNMVLERGVTVCAVFAGTESNGYRYVIGSKTEDVRKINQLLKEKFSARGGGKPMMVQGSLVGTENQIRALF